MRVRVSIQRHTARVHTLVERAPFGRGRIFTHERRAKHETHGSLHVLVAPDEIECERDIVFADQLLGALDGGGGERVSGDLRGGEVRLGYVKG